ncbi:MAG: hypothetical protein IT483_02390 [Gammaproteobacteria bacterium]|nr:hypothetical protein [Gammaproteobacteria bacterium]
MSRAIVAVTDFPHPGSLAEPPRLPALERLLARAETPPEAVPDWRRWVQQQVGIRVAGATLPVARIARGREGHWLLATPVHLMAGLERVHLHPEGALALDAGERAALERSFTASFGEAGMRLEFDERGECYIEMPHGIDATTRDPAEATGRIVDEYMPTGADAGLLKRLMTEIQMWLHVQPLNAAREAAGRLTVNALWLWGAAPGEPAVTLPASLPVLWSTDAYLVGLWRAAGEAVQGPGEAVSLWLGRGARRTAATLSLATMGMTAAGLPGTDRDWFEALLQAFAMRRLDEVELWITGRAVLLAQRDRWRVWRRVRPWHEVLSG